MRATRALLRFLAASVWTALLLPLAAVTRLPGLLGASQAGLRAGARLQTLWARGMLAALGVRVRAEGLPERGVFVVVANHLSYLDIMVLGSLLPGRFVAKGEIAGWHVIGWMSRSVGTLFVDQGRRRDVVRVGAEMRRTLGAGVNVFLFPEGGAQRGDRVHRLHSSLFEPAVREGMACLPVALSYETPRDPDGPTWTVAWWGGMGLARHVSRLLRLDRIEASVRCAQPVCGEGRKDLARRAQRSLEGCFRPLAQEPVPSDLPWPWLVEASPDPARGDT